MDTRCHHHLAAAEGAAEGVVEFSDAVVAHGSLLDEASKNKRGGDGVPATSFAIARVPVLLHLGRVVAAFRHADCRTDTIGHRRPQEVFEAFALANMLSELRKYRVGFTVAHQYMHQIEPDIRHAVLGNAGTIISFRVGAEDAPYMVQEFHERFDKIDFLQLPNYRVYVKLMIDGMPSKPFSAITLAPAPLDNPEIGLTA